jgi:transcriptional regulator with XRE-family HTH domain
MTRRKNAGSADPAAAKTLALGTRLLTHRRLKGFTLAKVGAHMGVTAQSVSQWERGLNEPTIERLQKLADLYKVELAALISAPSNVATLADRAEKLTRAVETVDKPALTDRRHNGQVVRDNGAMLVLVQEIHEFNIDSQTRDLRDVPVIYEWHLPQNLLAHVTGDVRIFRSTTDTLLPLIAPNDYLLIDITQQRVWGHRGVYIFTDGHQPAVRRIVPVLPVENTPPSIRIYNPMRDVEERVVPESAITILGRVIGKVTMWL